MERLKIEKEISKRDSICKFLEEVILPRLSDEKKKAINKHIKNGIAIDGAMELEGVKYHIRY